MKHNPPSCSQSGFALAWAAVLTIVAGLSAVTLVTVMQNQQSGGALVETENSIDTVLGAIMAYERDNSRLPCPASMIAPIAAAEFGIARDQAPVSAAGVCDNSGAADVISGRTHTWRVNDGGNRIRVGAIPNRTIGLADHLTQDKWGNRLVYAVTENVVIDAANNGVIDVDDGGAVATNIRFLILSQGPRQIGAYTYYRGSEVRPCNGEENCDFGSNDDYLVDDPSLIQYRPKP